MKKINYPVLLATSFVISLGVASAQSIYIPPTASNGPVINGYVQPPTVATPTTTSIWMPAQGSATSGTAPTSGSFGSPNLTMTQNNNVTTDSFCAVPAGYNFSYGNQSVYTKSMQEYLFPFVNSTYQSTGYFGQGTKNAIKKYQARHGISQTGYVGPITLKQMQLDWCSGNGNSGSLQSSNPVPPSGDTTINNSQVSLTSISSKTNYTKGEAMTITATVTNIGTSSITFASGSSRCPDDIRVTLNGVDFYSFTNQNMMCTMDLRYQTLLPGQSRSLTFTGTIPTTAQPGTYQISTSFKPNGSVIKSVQSTITIN